MRDHCSWWRWMDRWLKDHYPFKIGGRTLNASYILDVFKGGGVIFVDFYLFFKARSSCKLSYKRLAKDGLQKWKHCFPTLSYLILSGGSLW